MNITVGYRQYQTLVSDVPNIGTSHTGLWYFPYPIEVSAVLPL